jgi:hypothetical protein
MKTIGGSEMSHRTSRIAGLLLAAGVIMSSISPLAAQSGGSGWGRVLA